MRRPRASMAPAMPDTAWVLASDAEAWETHARACFAAFVEGECPLDVTRKNILNFSQGSFSLIEADLRATLPADLAAAVTKALVREGLAEAFDLRKNLVSLKKVLLHCWHAADPLEHELRRMATFWRDDMNFENGFVQVQRYREVCVAHMRCKGASHAAYDGRVLTKQICCVPRHPDAPRPARLERMPASLTTRSWLRQARDALRAAGDAGDDDGDDAGDDDGDDDGDDTGDARDDIINTGDDVVEEGTKTPARAALDAFLAGVARRVRDDDTSGWTGFIFPKHVAALLERVLIARGGAKALAIRDETERYAAHLEATARAFEKVSARLEARTRSVETVLVDDFGARGVCSFPDATDPRRVQKRTDPLPLDDERGSPGLRDVRTDVKEKNNRTRSFRERGVDYDETAVANLRVANVHDRLRGLLFGCAPATRDLSWAVAEILKKPGTRLFAAGDHGGADFFPAEFRLGTLIARHRATVAKWRPVLFAELDAMVPGLAISGTTLSGTNLEAVKVPRKKTDATSAAESDPGKGNATWPPDAAQKLPALSYLRGKQKCGACGGAFGGLWVQAGTCFRCDAVARSAGVCPKSVRLDGGKQKTENRKHASPCPRSAWCPHRRRCLACEALFFSGCASCGVTRGDGEDVALMAESAPSPLLCVFLDFDRTLCATKRGASPRLAGSPPRFVEFDAALMSVATSHGETHVVTRNRHVADIVAFLAHHGVRDAASKVHSVSRGESKAGAMRAAMASAAARGGKTENLAEAEAVFVDDSIAELMDEEVAAIPGLTRVLFSRVVA